MDSLRKRPFSGLHVLGQGRSALSALYIARPLLVLLLKRNKIGFRISKPLDKANGSILINHQLRKPFYLWFYQQDKRKHDLIAGA